MSGGTTVLLRIGRLLAVVVLAVGIQVQTAPSQTVGEAPPRLHIASSRSGHPTIWSLLARQLVPGGPRARPALNLGSTVLSWPPKAQFAPDVTLAEPAGIRAPIQSVIRLVFSQPMDFTTVESSFKVVPAVDGLFEWPDAQTLVFRPAAPLAYRTTYHVNVAGFGMAQRRLVAVAGFAFSTLWPPPAVPFPFTLTFDDCGTADQIQAILNALADRGLHAIFFPTGLCRDQFPWLIPTLIAAGHRVCNHTYSHPDLSRLSAPAIASEIQRGVSVQCDLFRPPYGAMDRYGRVYSVAASLGYKIQLWDVDTRDWAGTPADVMVAMIRGKGGIVLMHMHGPHTLEAIRAL